MVQKTYLTVAVVLALAMFIGAESGWAQRVQYRFNGGSGGGATVFDSRGGHHASVPGNPTWVSGRFGTAMELDGDGDYLEVDQIYELDSEQTKMLWIHMKDFPDDGVYLIDQGGEGNNNWIELYDSNGDGNPQIRAGFDSFNYIDGKTGLRCGYWYHIAVVSRRTGEIAIYINGVLDRSVSALCGENMPTQLVIGTDCGTRTGCFAGLIDEIAIYDRTLSAGEIRRVYQSTVARYRHALDNTRFVVESIQQAIAAKKEILASLDVALKKTQLACEALVRFTAAGYDPISNEGSRMITAMQKLKADLMDLKQSQDKMTAGIEQLEGVLILLGAKTNPRDKSTGRPQGSPR